MLKFSFRLQIRNSSADDRVIRKYEGSILASLNIYSSQNRKGPNQLSMVHSILPRLPAINYNIMKYLFKNKFKLMTSNFLRSMSFSEV
jgi:hypothetical protein